MGQRPCWCCVVVHGGARGYVERGKLYRCGARRQQTTCTDASSQPPHKAAVGHGLNLVKPNNTGAFLLQCCLYRSTAVAGAGPWKLLSPAMKTDTALTHVYQVHLRS